MNDPVAYYPGCSLEGLAVEYDLSTRSVCHALGLSLVELEDWNCCGSTPASLYDPMLSATLAGRNLLLAQRARLKTVMTPCPGCLKALKGAIKAHALHSEAFEEALGHPYEGTVRAVSVLQLLYEKVGPNTLAHAVRWPLDGLSVVPYYGCLLTRPERSAQFDDPENPVSMDLLLEALGCVVPHFPFKTECCGATSGITRADVVARLSGRLLDMARRSGAQAIVVACPLCQQNLDLRQAQAEKAMRSRFGLPVLYLTQIIGWALGLPEQDLGLGKLVVSPFGVLPVRNRREPSHSECVENRGSPLSRG
ncbi:CoB--CoM heterodisulfide reductase iron-sulfur subunit B family protein [Desulfosoma caldarium]|nr:CoB--CoM heterodisulfide reductase iron-sulfur subunit B family protein [Desulfosoma caldarium]